MLWGNIKFFYKVTTCKEWTSFLQLGKKHVANMMVVKGFVEERTKEYLLFVVIFWLLQQGQPFANFETMKVLVQFLKVKHISKKH